MLAWPWSVLPSSRGDAMLRQLSSRRERERSTPGNVAEIWDEADARPFRGAARGLDDAAARLLQALAPQHVAVAGDALEQHFDHRMVDRAAAAVGDEVLLGNIGLVGAALGILRQEMIEGLILRRAALGGNRLVPFLGIAEQRVDVEDHP